MSKNARILELVPARTAVHNSRGMKEVGEADFSEE